MGYQLLRLREIPYRILNQKQFPVRGSTYRHLSRCAHEDSCKDSYLLRRELLLASFLGGVAGPGLAGPAMGKTETGWYNIPEVTTPRTIVITGANSGIGLAASGKLAAAGHNVHLVCRSLEKSIQACDKIKEHYGPIRGTVSPHECELSSLRSVRVFAESWQAKQKPIDTLCLNAGAQFVGEKEPRRTREGFELTVGVNHLGHFLLCNLLLASVEASSNQPRIVITASEVHDPLSAGGKVGPGADLGSLQGLSDGPRFEMVSGDPYDADKAYKDSKLCNVMFARELARRLQDKDSSVCVNSFGPGLITRTGFFRNQSPFFVRIFDFATNNILGLAETVQGGGDCLAKMSVDPSLDGVSGTYFNNKTTGLPVFSPGHSFQQKDPSEEAQDIEKGKKLWDLSGQLVGLTV